MAKKEFYGEPYADIQWRAEDVKELRPKWSLKKCEEWLSSNEKYLRDRTTELGWEVMSDLL